MRFEKLRLRNMGAFHGDVEIDLTTLPGPLVSLSGANGAGKTSLLELFPGAAYRECPTRGSLSSLATARDSYVEVTVVNGARHVIRQLCDGVSKKGETLIADEHGTPLVESGKVRDADRWVAEHMPSPEILYSSSFAIQGRRGFLDLSAAERKQLLIEILDMKRLEQLADLAGERRREAKAALDVLSARVADVGVPDLAALDAAANAARERVERAVEAVRGARVALGRAKAAAGDAARQVELAEQRRAAEARLGAAQQALADLQERLRNNQAVLERGAEIRAAVIRASELDALIESTRTAAREAGQRVASAKAVEDVARAAFSRVADEMNHAQGRALRLHGRLKDRDQVLAAASELERLRAHESEIETEIRSGEDAVQRAEALLLTGKDQRIAGLRQGLTQISEEAGHDDGDMMAPSWAAHVLGEDDERAKEAAGAPALLDVARSRISTSRAALAGVRREIAAAQALAARAGEIAQAEADLAQARQDETAGSEKIAAAKQARDVAGEQRDVAARAAEQADAALSAHQHSRGALNEILALRARLDTVEARIEELTQQVAPTRARVEQAQAELATLPAMDPTTPVDVATHERMVVRQEEDERGARDQLARDESAIERAKATLETRAALLDQQRAAEDELADWTRLSQDLGRDGIQAMEIDAAIPELNTLANALLHECHGSRFTIDLRTDRLSADGKRVLEGLDVRVIDTVNGRDANADTYSGGELVLVGSALSLALTVLACRRSGAERPTLFLDEAGAALDQSNTRAWIAMLRRAVAQIGADKAVFISHSVEAQELADAHIWIADGRISVSP